MNRRPVGLLPILIGERRKTTVRRAARHADDWLTVNATLNEPTRCAAGPRVRRAEVERAAQPFEIRTGVKGPFGQAAVDELAAVGLARNVIISRQLAGLAGQPSSAATTTALIACLDDRRYRRLEATPR